MPGRQRRRKAEAWERHQQGGADEEDDDEPLTEGTSTTASAAQSSPHSPSSPPQRIYTRSYSLDEEGEEEDGIREEEESEGATSKLKASSLEREGRRREEDGDGDGGDTTGTERWTMGGAGEEKEELRRRRDYQREAGGGDGDAETTTDPSDNEGAAMKLRPRRTVDAFGYADPTTAPAPRSALYFNEQWQWQSGRRAADYGTASASMTTNAASAQQQSPPSEIVTPTSPYTPGCIGAAAALQATTPQHQRHQEERGGNSPDDALRGSFVVDGAAIVRKYHDAPFEAVLAFLMAQPGQKSSVTQIAEALDWETSYEDDNGEIKEFIRSYHAVFLLSPMSDVVQYRGGVLKATTKSRRLKTTLQGTNDRDERVYSMKRATNRYVASKKSEFDLGSVSYTAVCNRIDIGVLADIYRRRNLHTEQMTTDCLLIQFAGFFDVFVFSNGAIVWWGINRSDHWVVDDDFIADNPNIRKALSTRYPTALVNKLFPEWLTYSTSPERVESLSEFLKNEFEEKLNYDHFYLPRHEDNTYVRAAISHALSHAAKLEVFEDYVQASSDAAMGTPQELTQTGEASLHTQQVSMLIGDLQLTKWRFGESIEDVPIFFWDYPRLTGFFERAREQFNIDLRVKCFHERGSALTTGLDTLRRHRHRLHMISSEHVLIIILGIDMLLLLSRLCITLFFVEPTKEQVML